MRRIASCGKIQIFARFIADAITTETLDGGWNPPRRRNSKMEKPDLEDFILKLREWEEHKHGDQKLFKELIELGRKLGIDIKPVPQSKP
jgi:hypothetical protein